MKQVKRWKKASVLCAVLAVLFLAEGCGRAGAVGAVNRGTEPRSLKLSETNTVKARAAKEKTDQPEFRRLEFDFDLNSLLALDYRKGKTVASCEFDKPQLPIVMAVTEKGFQMISAEGSAVKQGGNGVGIVTGERKTESLFCYYFDGGMKLLRTEKLTEAKLLDGIRREIACIAPDGSELVFSDSKNLYRYVFRTGKTERIDVELKESVIYEAVQYADDGRTLAYYGSLAGRDGTAYGVIDLKSKRGSSFYEESFTGVSLRVNGNYALVESVVLPDRSKRKTKKGMVLLLDMKTRSGQALELKSMEEAGNASVSSDGSSVITCRETDGGLMFSCYRSKDGKLLKENKVKLKEKCRVTEVLAAKDSAWAILFTEKGNKLSEAFLFR